MLLNSFLLREDEAMRSNKIHSIYFFPIVLSLFIQIILLILVIRRINDVDKKLVAISRGITSSGSSNQEDIPSYV